MKYLIYNLLTGKFYKETKEIGQNKRTSIVVDRFTNNAKVAKKFDSELHAGGFMKMMENNSRLTYVSTELIKNDQFKQDQYKLLNRRKV